MSDIERYLTGIVLMIFIGFIIFLPVYEYGKHEGRIEGRIKGAGQGLQYGLDLYPELCGEKQDG